MRLGEIFLGAEFISANQLAQGLNYAKAKSIPIGRVLKLLRFITEDQLTDALVIQEMISRGLDSHLGILILKRSRLEGVNVKEAFENTLAERSISHESLQDILDARPAANMGKLLAPCEEIDFTPNHWLTKGDELFKSNNCGEAEVAYKKACELYATRIGDTSLEFADACLRLANLYLTTDDWSHAEELYLRVLDLRQQKLGENSPLVAKSLEDVGDLYAALKDYHRGMQYYQMALLIRERALPAEADSFITSLRRLHKFFLYHAEKPLRVKTGEIMIDSGMLQDKSVTKGLQSSQYRRLPLGSVLADDGSVSKEQIASVLCLQIMVKQRRISEFIGLRCLKAATALKTSFKDFVEKSIFSPGDHPDNFYLELMKEQEQLLEAEFEFGYNHPIVAQMSYNLAALYMSHDLRLEAEFLYKRAYSVWSKNPIPNDAQQFYDCASMLAELFINRDNYDEAEPILMQCLTLNLKSGNVQANYRTLTYLAKVKEHQGSTDAAASFLRSAMSLLPTLQRPPLLGLQDLRWIANVFLSASLVDDLNRLLDFQIDEREKRNLPVETDLRALYN